MGCRFTVHWCDWKAGVARRVRKGARGGSRRRRVREARKEGAD